MNTTATAIATATKVLESMAVTTKYNDIYSRIYVSIDTSLDALLQRGETFNKRFNSQHGTH